MLRYCYINNEQSRLGKKGSVFSMLINKLTKLVPVNMVGYYVGLVPFSVITDFTICVHTVSRFITELNTKTNLPGQCPAILKVKARSPIQVADNLNFVLKNL